MMADDATPRIQTCEGCPLSQRQTAALQKLADREIAWSLVASRINFKILSAAAIVSAVVVIVMAFKEFAIWIASIAGVRP